MYGFYYHFNSMRFRKSRDLGDSSAAIGLEFSLHFTKDFQLHGTFIYHAFLFIMDFIL